MIDFRPFLFGGKSVLYYINNFDGALHYATNVSHSRNLSNCELRSEEIKRILIGFISMLNEGFCFVKALGDWGI